MVSVRACKIDIYMYIYVWLMVHCRGQYSGYWMKYFSLAEVPRYFMGSMSTRAKGREREKRREGGSNTSFLRYIRLALDFCTFSLILLASFLFLFFSILMLYFFVSQRAFYHCAATVGVMKGKKNTGVWSRVENKKKKRKKKNTSLEHRKISLCTGDQEPCALGY